MPNNESKTPLCPKCNRPVNLGNSPNTSECTETDDDDGICEAYAQIYTLTEENKKLKEELELANQKLNNHAILSFSKYAELCAVNLERDQLKSQLVELQADKEMLDWLDRNRVNHIYDHFKYHSSTAATEKTWRLAITAAMKGTK